MRDRQSRNALVEKHLPLAKAVAGRFHRIIGPRVPYGDLLSAAYEGLIEAAERFRPKQGVQFKTYSDHVMRGRVRDWLRSMDQCPRHLRNFVNERERVQGRLSGELGRQPDDDETAAAMGLTQARYRDRIREAASLLTVSIDASQDSRIVRIGTSRARRFLNGPERRIDDLDLLERVTRGLSDRERAILLLWAEGYTNAQIGERLGISSSWVWKLVPDTLTRVRQMHEQREQARAMVIEQR